MCSTCFPRSSLPADASLSSTGSSRASSPASSVLSKRYDALLPSRRTSFPSLGGTSVALVVSLPDGRVSRQGLELVTRCLQPGVRRGAKNRTLPSSWGTSMIRLPCSKPTPAGLLAPDHTVQQRGPWSSKGRGSHDWVFRRSIAWLSDSLSTLRGVSYLSTTQDSLPVAGQALLDGISTRKVPMKGFKVVIYISSPFPKLCLAQSMQPRAGGNRLNYGR
jgi:hypothetical protein